MSIQRVLCPIDLSEHSRLTLHHAQATATWYDAELHVLHVRQDVMPVVASSHPVAPPNLIAGVGAAPPMTALHAFIAETGPPRPVFPVVRDGKPAPVIVDYAAEVGADLLVIGTHGHGGFERLLLGSTAEHVINEAPCPVLNIPARGDEPGSAERVRFTHILCAVDFSPASMRALERGLSLAQEFAARVSLLHVLELPAKIELVSEMGVPLHEYVARKAAEAHERLAAAVPQDARSWCRVQELVRTGRSAPIILQEAELCHADLIVMGSQGHQGISLAFLGSTTHTVLRGAGCPVLTAHGAPAPRARAAPPAAVESGFER
jgi:nucleotide-binding universal stress UspA family protein